MRERSFDEMIAYFNRRVADMDINQDYKMELLGMVTALGVKHKKSARHWKPCSERLPDKYGVYLVTLVTMTEKAKAEELGFDVDEIDVRKMRYNSNGWQLPRHIPSWINEVVTDEVIAWMPLPEPYQEEGEHV